MKSPGEIPLVESLRGVARRVAGGPARRAAWGLFGLWLVTAAVYLPSLSGGYLAYDDPWLIERNPLLSRPLGEAVRAIAWDFSRDTRLALGAEYLPVRDLSYLADRSLLGLDAPGMRGVQLGLYLLALWLLRAALSAVLGDARRAQVATLAFALHPVHVESVAWLSGRKDVLALLFVCAACRAYEGRGRARWWAPVFVALACFSKSMAVVAPGLLLAQDLLAQRRPRLGPLLAAGATSLAALLVHLGVGVRVAMLGGPLSAPDVSAFWTMGGVWLRYAGQLAFPMGSSVIYEVDALSGPSLLSALGWALVFASGAWTMARLLRGRSRALGLWIWIALPLLPVSQVFVALQNVMADRYLWLSALGLGLILALAVDRHRFAPGLVALALTGLALSSSQRAALFGDSVALFRDAAEKTRGPLAPYQVGVSFERRGDPERAASAYRDAIDRPCTRCEPARRASNNLARLLVAEGELERAESVLRAALARFPDDPKLAFNLVRVLHRLGRAREAQRLYDRSLARFPDYFAASGS